MPEMLCHRNLGGINLLKYMSLLRHLWHQRQHRRLDCHDGFALLFEHVARESVLSRNLCNFEV
jgi:hypothetical protein